jgi:hypothetical protein
MSHAARKIAADTLGHGQFNARWMVEITYNNDRPALIFTVAELEDIDEIVERGPDWRTIEHIVITLNKYVPMTSADVEGDRQRYPIGDVATGTPSMISVSSPMAR